MQLLFKTTQPLSVSFQVKYLSLSLLIMTNNCLISAESTTTKNYCKTYWKPPPVDVIQSKGKKRKKSKEAHVSVRELTHKAPQGLAGFCQGWEKNMENTGKTGKEKMGGKKKLEKTRNYILKSIFYFINFNFIFTEDERQSVKS